MTLKKTHHQSTQSLLSLNKILHEGEKAQRFFQLSFYFVGIVLAVANVFVASRLEPVFSAIKDLRAEDARLETRTDTNKDSIQKLVDITSDQTKILERVDERSKIILDILKTK